MADRRDLETERENLKRQLDDNAFQSQLMACVDGIGRFFKFVFRMPEPPSYWFSTILITLITLMVSFAISLIFGDFEAPYRFDLIPLEVSTTALLFLLLVIHKLTFQVKLKTVRHFLLDAVESVEDITRLRRYLISLKSRKIVFFTICFDVPMIGVSSYFIIKPRIHTITPGIILFTAIVLSAFGMIFYTQNQLCSWVIRLRHYRFKIFSANPSSSEIIERLSEMIRKILLLTSLFGVGLTLFFTVFDLTSIFWIALLIALLWIPVITLFIAGHSSLSYLITNAKRRTLNRIQDNVERLEKHWDGKDSETIESIKRLVQYHNHVMITPNSAIDIRAKINFLNSLLLPILAFLFANVKRLIALF